MALTTKKHLISRHKAPKSRLVPTLMLVCSLDRDDRYVERAPKCIVFLPGTVKLHFPIPIKAYVFWERRNILTSDDYHFSKSLRRQGLHTKNTSTVRTYTVTVTQTPNHEQRTHHSVALTPLPCQFLVFYKHLDR